MNTITCCTAIIMATGPLYRETTALVQILLVPVLVSINFRDSHVSMILHELMSPEEVGSGHVH